MDSAAIGGQAVPLDHRRQHKSAPADLHILESAIAQRAPHRSWVNTISCSVFLDWKRTRALGVGGDFFDLTLGWHAKHLQCVACHI
jgi:hypothetical protein